MNRNRRFELWINGMLVVVCLLLIGVLVRQMGKEPALRLIGLDRARSVSLGEHPAASSHEEHKARGVEGAVSSFATAMSTLHPRAQGAWHQFGPEQANRPASMLPSEAHPQAITTPQPETTTLVPLGFVENADGRVEAIIPAGEHVQVVHEGDILDDNFRVAKISSSAVELVANSAPAAESHLLAETGQSVVQGPVNEARQTPPPPVPHVLSNLAPNRRPAADSSAGVSQPFVGQALGYVERADGRVEAVVAEGQDIRLAQATKAFARSFHPPAPPPVDLEVANATPPPTNPPESLDNESQPQQNGSSTQQAEAPPLVASGSESSSAGMLEGTRGNNGESEQFGIMQPEPLAEYSGGRCGTGTLACAGGDLAPVLHVGPPSAAPQGAAAPPLFSGGKGAQPAISALGYVEKAGGEKEAIVEVFGEVYLVHAGELFAEKFRALKVTSSSIEIVEETPGGVSPPAKPERDSKAVRPRSPE